MRPSTLNLRHQQNHDVSRSFLREAYTTWNECSENNIVPEHKIKTLFGELKLFLHEDQVHDIIRTAKLIDKAKIHSILNCRDASQTVEISQIDSRTSETRPSAGISSDEHNEPISGPEVFLGGSCNPTTWRADIAIPTLNLLGISFYNPQVSEWTPDLLELEHRAKEKARVLFFPQQKILNETLLADEYMDLSRNQLLLRQLMKRRGLPVLDNIPLALEYIKNVLSGGACREHPQNVATRLISVRRTCVSPIKGTNLQQPLIYLTDSSDWSHRIVPPSPNTSHYIGMGYNIVMCVQMMNNSCSIRGSQLSDSAVKDYNRGRAYLVDLAKRHGIPVFEEIDAAVKCAVEKLTL
ncbi:hypothetical protein quinque_008890 [Culex quinquefasciatus]